MAAHLSLTQLSSANPVYEKYYRQVDPGNTGRVLASDAAVFLKKSGLTDLILGKIWDLADTDGKGILNKQNDSTSPLSIGGAPLDIPWAVKVEDKSKYDAIFDSLNPVNGLLSGDKVKPVLLNSKLPVDILGRVEDKSKYDAIFDSLNPVNGLLSGDKVKPVLLNSKLPVDILGRVWELSDIDHDGMLDRDEFAVAMFLVYCALEKEPVPLSLPPTLVPPSKRKALSLPSAGQLMPPSTSSKEAHQSIPSVGLLPSKAPSTQWVVSPADKVKYHEIFLKTDKDMDGFVSGVEARELFLKTGLPSALLAHIWALCDTKDSGKLSDEQFILAFHFISQKLTKGIDPPQVLSPDMIPPSERSTPQKNTLGPSPVADFSAIKELDTLSNEIVDLQKEKNNVEQDLKEKEDAIKQRTSEIQDLQDEVKRESNNLQRLLAQKEEAEEILNGLDEEKAKLEEQLNTIRQKCAEEADLIASLKAEITDQESKISTYKDELNKAQEELIQLQQETTELEKCVEAGKLQLRPLQQDLQVQEKLHELKELESSQSSWEAQPHSTLLNGNAEHSSLSNSSSETANLNENVDRERADTEQLNHEFPARNSPETVEVEEEKEVLPPVVTKQEDPCDEESHQLSEQTAESTLDFFESDPFDSDPFKDDPFGKIDPFGGDPFKGSDPFAADCFFKQSSTDPFGSIDPFSATSNNNNSTIETLAHNDPFAPGGTAVTVPSDTATDLFASLFGNESFSSGFADFSTLSKANNEDPFSSSATGSMHSVIITKNVFEEPPAKNEDVPPALPPKTGTPTRPCPPPPGKRPINKVEPSDSLKLNDPFFPGCDGSKEQEADLFHDPFAPTGVCKEKDDSSFASFNAYPTEEDMIEWAKRESEREEKERLARLKQQEQEDLELAIALSKSEISEA
ncbi:PREDICTED: epidermal growth factor receptor substrate 15 [Gekko japonicus]|uniref:Epidermal growth factor receptor substrate 15 n=1 Tax=Gekko japonicus TaxID=146911 RepID=A0ABM1K162_GEKJA|nr:PREDICTED: epidermal growth factor receptor substrate 15 [Gekko japonicus]